MDEDENFEVFISPWKSFRPMRLRGRGVPPFAVRTGAHLQAPNC